MMDGQYVMPGELKEGGRGVVRDLSLALVPGPGVQQAR